MSIYDFVCPMQQSMLPSHPAAGTAPWWEGRSLQYNGLSFPGLQLQAAFNILQNLDTFSQIQKRKKNV